MNLDIKELIERGIMSEEKPKPEEPTQKSLWGHTDDREMWEKEWEGMPEYMMQNMEAKKQLKINFLTIEHYDEFCKLIGQTLTSNTKSTWFPAVGKGRNSDKVYTDEEIKDADNIHDISNLHSKQEEGGDIPFDSEFSDL